ncbi:MAG: hypothetical protein CVU24_07430 [Betaproteobacteria bacterium HGW-Betaproteobacteria-18]|nr:MAG: hypothetical protein CVU24_07430 [Betaproteobacteria bacterium HGW-Betaproteobacteria-18]
MCLALLLAGWTLPNNAAQSSTQFAVSVTLRSAAAAVNTGLCRSTAGVGAFGATLTVTCTTGKVIGLDTPDLSLSWVSAYGGAYRALTHVSGDTMSGTVDSYTGTGTSTEFRIVSLADKEYIEMTVVW